MTRDDHRPTPTGRIARRAVRRGAVAPATCARSASTTRCAQGGRRRPVARDSVAGPGRPRTRRPAGRWLTGGAPSGRSASRVAAVDGVTASARGPSGLRRSRDPGLRRAHRQRPTASRDRGPPAGQTGCTGTAVGVGLSRNPTRRRRRRRAAALGGARDRQRGAGPRRPSTAARRTGRPAARGGRRGERPDRLVTARGARHRSGAPLARHRRRHPCTAADVGSPQPDRPIVTRAPPSGGATSTCGAARARPSWTVGGAHRAPWRLAAAGRPAAERRRARRAASSCERRLIPGGVVTRGRPTTTQVVTAYTQPVA